MAQTNNIGKVSLTPRGAYNASTAYEYLDIVTFNGASYIVLQSVIGVAPPNATYYQLIASKGDTGANGQSPTISVGTVSSSGDSVSVENTGTAVNAVFDFTFPDYVTSSEVLSSGIIAESYTTLFGGSFSVTTVQTQDYNSPYARASVTGRIPQNYLYRVTLDGTEYIVPCSITFYQNFYPANYDSRTKAVEYLGNLSHRTTAEVSGLTHTDPDVPFLIISDYDDNNSIDVYTEDSGQHTLLVEKITFTGTLFPHYLIYGGQCFPLEFIVTDSSTFNGVSIGSNKLIQSRGTIAVGNGNEINSQFGFSFGLNNYISTVNAQNFAVGCGNDISNATIGQNNYAIGWKNTVTSNYYALALGFKNTVSSPQSSVGIGIMNTISGKNAFGFGSSNTVSGQSGYAIGESNTVSGKSALAIGHGCIANHLNQFVSGSYNVADPSSADSTAAGTYLEIVGNGTDNSNRSNARTLDYGGNETLSGGITLGKGTADEVSLSAAQLKQLLALL